MRADNSKLFLVVVGPTGSGKSSLALNLAERFDGEIVNCDSLQLYRGMNIGTAKVPVAERRRIRHHLLDILEPEMVFTAGDYSRAGREVIQDITSRGRLPIVVGGTGFYLRALTEGLFAGPVRDAQLRSRLMRRPERLHKLLHRLDPQAASRIHPNDVQKLIRAVEISVLARRPVTLLHETGRDRFTGFSALKIGLDPPRAALVALLDERCEGMFASGLVEEMRSLLAAGHPAESKAFEAIGYREALLFIRGEIGLPGAIRLTQAATRQYAKRQMTWFRRDPEIHWIRGFGNKSQTIETAFGLVEKQKNIST